MPTSKRLFNEFSQSQTAQSASYQKLSSSFFSASAANPSAPTLFSQTLLYSGSSFGPEQFQRIYVTGSLYGGVGAATYTAANMRFGFSLNHATGVALVTKVVCVPDSNGVSASFDVRNNANASLLQAWFTNSFTDNGTTGLAAPMTAALQTTTPARLIVNTPSSCWVTASQLTTVTGSFSVYVYYRLPIS